MLDWSLVLAGLALLVAGGAALVRGASGIALPAKVTPAVVGLTIVAAGTSMPFARGNDDLGAFRHDVTPSRTRCRGFGPV